MMCQQNLECSYAALLCCPSDSTDIRYWSEMRLYSNISRRNYQTTKTFPYCINGNRRRLNSARPFPATPERPRIRTEHSSSLANTHSHPRYFSANGPVQGWSLITHHRRVVMSIQLGVPTTFPGLPSPPS